MEPEELSPSLQKVAIVTYPEILTAGSQLHNLGLWCYVRQVLVLISSHVENVGGVQSYVIFMPFPLHYYCVEVLLSSNLRAFHHVTYF
jgi:hypothetical protein